MLSASITTKIVGSNLTNGEVCSIKHYVIKLGNDLRLHIVFIWVLPFPPPIKLSYC